MYSSGNGEINQKYSFASLLAEGLAWDGEYLWNVDIKGGIPLSENYDGKVYQIDPENGKVLKTIQAPSSSPRGLTWDGTYLWCVDDASNEVIQFSPDDGTTIRSFSSPPPILREYVLMASTSGFPTEEWMKSIWLSPKPEVLLLLLMRRDPIPGICVMMERVCGPLIIRMISCTS